MARRAAPPVLHAVDQYAADVLAGRVLAGEYVRLACERHVRDRETGDGRGLTFDTAAADRAFTFFSQLPLPDGVNAGGAFVLLPWQQFVIGSLFGWKRANGTRRFRYALVEVARSNGKSPMLAGCGLYLLVADKQQGAQVYSAATTRDQAKIVWTDASRMALGSALARRITKTVNNLAFVESGSYFRPLAAEANTMDGLRVHGALVDELHEHPSAEVMNKLRTGMKTTQPLLFAITTAGYDRHSVCWDEHDHVVKVLEQTLDDDAYFGYIASLDPEDDWTDEAVWPKANPSLGVTVSLDTLREECAMAQQIPGQQNAFKRLRCNIWTEQASRWLDMRVYDENDTHAIDPAAYRGQSCFTGLDLSTTTDITALVHLFSCPEEDGALDVVARFFVPEERIRQRAERDRVPYDIWADQGYIVATGGNVVDYDVVRDTILRDGERYQIREFGYDPWNATQLVTQLQGDGLAVVPIRQGWASLSPPTKELEKLVADRKFHHGGNPVLRWMFSNVAVAQDPAGNIKPAKDKSTERIDGVAATVTALARVIVHQGDGRSVYEERGVLVL